MLWLNNLVKRQLLKRGMIVSRPPGQFQVGAYKLRGMKERGLQIRCVVDGGAADGGWTREFKAIYPRCQVLCIEPREDTQANLRATAQELAGIQIAQALIGPREGEVDFHESQDQSSVLPDAQGKPFGRTVKTRMTTIDNLVAEHQLPPPDLIKLDLQGYELEALRGAEQCLKLAQAVLLEVSFLRLQAGSPIADEVIAFMRQRGFVVYDVLGLWSRPLDGALAQGDFFFLRMDHPLLADGRWSAAAAADTANRS